MSKSLVPGRGGRKTAATPQPKLARGTRDISPAILKAARGTRDLAPVVPIDSDDDTIVVDTIVVDPDPNLSEDMALEVADADPVEPSEVTESQAASIDARMLELGERRFGITAFRPGQALAIRNVLAGIDTLAIMPTGAGKS